MIRSLCIVGSGENSYQHFICAVSLNIFVKYIYTRNIKIKKKFIKKQKGITFFNDLNLIKKMNVDAFIVSVDWRQNDNIVSFFNSVKKPVLFEKPLGAFNKNFLNLKYKKNKFVALNRRNYLISQKVKEILEKKKKFSAEITISEKVESYHQRFNVNIKKILYFNSIHVIDLAVFYFQKLKKIYYTNKIFSKNQFKKSKYIFKDKNNNLVEFNFFNNSSENNSIKIRFDDKKIYHQCPIEKLRIYNGIKLKKKIQQKIFEPIIVKTIHENSKKFKAGYLRQMRMFKQLNNYKLVKIKSYLDTLNLIKSII
jgi:hypothetical protein